MDEIDHMFEDTYSKRLANKEDAAHSIFLDKRLVGLVDRSAAMCSALASQLNDAEEFECREFILGDLEILDVVLKFRPAILIIDPLEFGPPNKSNWAEVVGEIKRASPDTKLLGYTLRVDGETLRVAIEADLHGCVGRNSDLLQLKIAIAAILSGGMYFDPGFVPLLSRILGTRKAGADGLSERERQVVSRVAKGQNAKEIGSALSISAKTVETYKARAQTKLGLRSRAELVDYALSQGLWS
uniref:HTH luxR-type domain-containing protein n=2 Tax=Alloyangia mangrovi TaxID=1779329 RepID=A0A2A3JYI0_9RHOB